MTDSLLADDDAGPRLAWVPDEHRGLSAEPVQGAGRVLAGRFT